MKLLDSIAERFGWFKAAKLTELISGGYNFTSVYGLSTPENYNKYLNQYGQEAWVYACIYVIATKIAALPWYLYRYVEVDGKWERKPIIDRKVEAMLEHPDIVNGASTWYSLVELTVACMELTGNGYWYFEDAYGAPLKPKTIQAVFPSQIRINPSAAGQDSLVGNYVFIKNNGDKVPIPRERLLHFKYMSTQSYYYGQGSTGNALNAIETIREAERTNLMHFKNGGKLDGVLQTEQLLDDKTFQRLEKKWDLKYQQGARSKRIAILEKGLKYQQIVSNMKDLEYLGGIKLSREEICGVIGVPPLLVGILDNASYSNYEQAENVLWNYALIPKTIGFEAVVTNLVQRFNPEYYFGFDLTNVEALKEDEDMKSQIAVRYWAMGIPFDIINQRMNLKFPKIKGGDIGYLPFSVQPASMAAEPPPELTAPDPNAPKSIKITKEKKFALWKSFDRVARAIENRYKIIIAEHFLGVQIGILNRMSKMFDMATYQNKENFKDRIEITEFMFDVPAETKRWFNKSKRVHNLAVEQSGKDALRELGLSLSFNLQNPRVRQFIEEQGLEKAKTVIETLKEEIKISLSAGVDAGESIEELRKRIQEIFTPFQTAGYKAERIARTEVIGASNFGTLEAYKQSDLDLGKGWIAQFDGRARDSHMQAAEIYNEKNLIPLDEDFQVGSGAGPCPGSIGLAEEDINCRCRMFALKPDTNE